MDPAKGWPKMIPKHKNKKPINESINFKDNDIENISWIVMCFEKMSNCFSLSLKLVAL